MSDLEILATCADPFINAALTFPRDNARVFANDPPKGVTHMHKMPNDFAATGAQPPLSEAALHSQHVAQRNRCEARLGLTNAAIEEMVRGFLAAHGSATKCPAAYALPSGQYHLDRGAGHDGR
jgi:hypothetical protein